MEDACFVHSRCAGISILCFWFRRLHGSTLEEVIDSVFGKTPKNSHEVLSMLTNALLQPCAVALIKVSLHDPVQPVSASVALVQQSSCSTPVAVSRRLSVGAA